MEEILKELLTDPTKVIAAIRAKTKETSKIEEYRKEFKEHDRNLRATQVGRIQKDKTVNNNNVIAVKIPINFAQKIVTTSSAFEVGKPVTLIPSDENNLSKLMKQLWKINRLDHMIQKLVKLRKSETQGALQFYINDLTETSILNKILQKLGLKTQNKEIKVKLLDNISGIMTPYFDATGQMLAFMWEYSTLIDGKSVNNVEIWDKKFFHYLNDATGSMVYVDKKPKLHGFDRIPIVYDCQDEPEWFVVKEMIDRLETTLSKTGASNDYSAYPILQIFGEVTTLPDKDESGKVLQYPITPTLSDGVTPNPFPHGKAEFLESDNSVDSRKFEAESLEGYIYSISSTPNLAFDNVKGVSVTSGIAIKLMFMDAVMKAAMNEGQNRTMIERILNIMQSGIVTTTNTQLSNEGKLLYYDVIFNSILPDDLKEAVEIATSAVAAGIMSEETGIKYIDMVEDVQAEQSAIAKDRAAKKAVIPKTEGQ